MASLFSRIVAGELPAHKVAETKDYLAFLDVTPVKQGHVLCIPKAEVDYLFDMDDEAYIGLQLFAKAVAKGVKAAIPCTKVAVMVIGLEVPHAHIHLVPINTMSELDMSNKHAAKPEDLAKTAELIRTQL